MWSSCGMAILVLRENLAEGKPHVYSQKRYRRLIFRAKRDDIFNMGGWWIVTDTLRSNNHRVGSNITRVRGDSNADHYIQRSAHWQKWAKCTASHAEGLCRLVTQNVGLLLKTDTRRNEWPWEAPLRLITWKYSTSHNTVVCPERAAEWPIRRLCAKRGD